MNRRDLLQSGFFATCGIFGAAASSKVTRGRAVAGNAFPVKDKPVEVRLTMLSDDSIIKVIERDYKANGRIRKLIKDND